MQLQTEGRFLTPNCNKVCDGIMRPGPGWPAAAPWPFVRLARVILLQSILISDTMGSGAWQTNNLILCIRGLKEFKMIFPWILQWYNGILFMERLTECFPCSECSECFNLSKPWLTRTWTWAWQYTWTWENQCGCKRLEVQRWLTRLSDCLFMINLPFTFPIFKFDVI